MWKYALSGNQTKSPPITLRRSSILNIKFIYLLIIFVKKTCRNAFLRCSSLTSISITNNVTSIGKKTFLLIVK